MGNLNGRVNVKLLVSNTVLSREKEDISFLDGIAIDSQCTINFDVVSSLIQVRVNGVYPYFYVSLESCLIQCQYSGEIEMKENMDFFIYSQ